MGVGETYFVYNLSQLENGNSQPAMQSVTSTTAYATEARETTPLANGYFVHADTTGIQLTTITGDPVNGNVSLSTRTLSTPTFARTSTRRYQAAAWTSGYSARSPPRTKRGPATTIP